jgi:hypothetical protein
MVDRLAQWDVKLYCTDQWAAYASVIPQDQLVQKRWWISQWLCLPSFESMGTRMNSYHYLVEAL